MFIFSCFLLFLFILSNPLSYVLALAIFSIYSIFCSVYYYSMSSLLGLLFLLVYYGAVVVLVSYVCAIVPNIYYEGLSTMSIVFTILFQLFFFLMWFIFSGISFTGSEIPLSVSYLSSYFYTYLGAAILHLLFLIMLLVMISCSFYVKVSSPLRSL